MDPVRVAEHKIAMLEVAFEKLARKAAKLGMVAPKLVKGESVDVRYVEGHGLDGQFYVYEAPDGNILKPGQSYSFRRYVMVSCEGEAPVIDGWKLVAVIDHTTDQEIGNLIRNVPGMDCPSEYRHAAPICHHCGHERRRNETFLIVKDGEYRQIGRNCLADFCRDPEMAEGLIHSAEWVFAAQSIISDAEEDGGYGYGGINYYPIERVLAMSRCLIRQIGWVSKVAAGDWGFPTSSLVKNVITNPEWKKHEDRKFIEQVESLNDEDNEVAAKSLAWIRDKKADSDNLNDYIYNLLVVCSQDRIPAKHFGLACSLVQAWMKDQEMEIERKAKANRQPSEHFGTVGKRETWKLMVAGTNYWEGDYGVTSFIRFRDELGNVATWKASGTKEVEIGAEYSVKATVKAHSEFKGTKQTELSRAKMERISPVTEEEVLLEEHNAV